VFSLIATDRDKQRTLLVSLVKDYLDAGKAVEAASLAVRARVLQQENVPKAWLSLGELYWIWRAEFPSITDRPLEGEQDPERDANLKNSPHAALEASLYFNGPYKAFSKSDYLLDGFYEAVGRDAHDLIAAEWLGMGQSKFVYYYVHVGSNDYRSSGSVNIIPGYPAVVIDGYLEKGGKRITAKTAAVASQGNWCFNFVCDFVPKPAQFVDYVFDSVIPKGYKWQTRPVIFRNAEGWSLENVEKQLDPSWLSNKLRFLRTQSSPALI
jgi:hypothetical protein